jgi:hypothetical protein
MTMETKDVMLRVKVRTDGAPGAVELLKRAIAARVTTVEVAELVNDGFGNMVDADTPPLTSASATLEREQARRSRVRHRDA